MLILSKFDLSLESRSLLFIFQIRVSKDSSCIFDMDTAAEKVFRCKLENVVGKPLQTILPNVNLPKEAPAESTTTHVSIFNFRTPKHESFYILQKYI